MDVRAFNKAAWDRLVAKGDRWTRPVDAAAVASARNGDWSVLLTPAKPVPRAWFPPLPGRKVLCLASGGGQQGPLLAAAGAEVVVFDNSPMQLRQDAAVAAREGLSLRTVEGDMADLRAFSDASFDVVFHPCANMFVPDVRPVWKEAFRVLKPGGRLLAGFANPIGYLFDVELEKRNVLQLKYAMPYSDLTSLSPEERERLFGDEPLNFAHSLEDQIAGQTDAGFHIVGFYEDDWGGAQNVDRYLKVFCATLARKPDG
jgi:SAM-dependent methyltransferase